jgi:hypothetical protein
MASGRRNWPLRLLVVVVILAGLFVAADRIAVGAAERIAGDSIESSQNLSSRPDVVIHGFPFLTQFASATYDDVDVTAHDLPLTGGDRTLTVASLAVHLSHVTTTGSTNFDTVAARSATADARVTFDDLARTLGVRVLSSDGTDRLKTSVSITVGGQSVTGGVSAKVSASSDQGLTFSDVRVDAGGTGIAGAETALGAVFRVPIPLSGLPFGVRVTDLSVDPAGLVVHLAGRDLRYSTG